MKQLRPRIFAQLGTTKRSLVLTSDFTDTMRELNKLYGGEWIPVQDLEANQSLPFEATAPYLGFDKTDDYCGVLEKLPNKINPF